MPTSSSRSRGATSPKPLTRSLPVLTAAILLSLGVTSGAHAVQPNAPPVNPDSTPAARALLHELDNLSGHAILSGEHNYPNTVSQYSNRVYELTDKYPAIFGQDFGFAGDRNQDSTLSRPAMIREVVRQYHAGAIPALCWHAVPPTQDEPVTFQGSILGKLTDWEFQQLTTPGTDLHARWERQVDRIAGYLRELQEAGVPVLFRPYHEMNGNWFWWGGRPGENGSAALYRMILDRYVHVHHLNNLVWVWNVGAASSNAQPPREFWPGSAYVDVVSMDIYRPYVASDYQSMVELAGDTKPMALAEVGTVPDAAVLKEQPRWTYFMVWSEFAEDHNSPEGLRTTFNLPNVVSRGDARLAVPFAVPAADTSPQDEHATDPARALLSTLLSGRAAVEEINQGQAANATLRQEVERIHASGRAPLLRWTPPSPTGGSATEPLDAYTWSQLRDPATPLHRQWEEQIDALAATLRKSGNDALLLSPLPEANTGLHWWSRPGFEGSQALFHEVRQRLASAGLHQALWVWEPGAKTPEHNPSAAWDPYYPGPLGVDAYILDLDGDEGQRASAIAALKVLSVNSPVAAREPATSTGEASVSLICGRCEP